MKKIFIILAVALLILIGATNSAKAAPVSWDGNISTNVLQPLQSLWGAIVKMNTFQATSTIATSTIAGGLAIDTSGLVYDWNTDRVGIGTAAPATVLHIDDTGSTLVTIEGGATNSPGILLNQTTTNKAFVRYIDNGANTDNLELQSDGNIYLNSVSNIGIGSTTPFAKLSIESSTANDGLYLKGTNSAANSVFRMLNDTGAWAQFFVARSGSGGDAGKFVITVGSGAANGMVIDTTGRVGFGTNSPLSKVGIVGSTAIGATYGALAGPTDGLIVEGNVGIGTTNPLNALVIGGSQAGNAGIEYALSSSATIQCFNRTASTYCATNFDGSTVNFRSNVTSGASHTFRKLTTTLAAASTGAAFDYATAVTNAAADFTGINLTTAAVTAANTNTLRGIVVSPGAITNSAGATTYAGLTVNMPAITQSGGTLNSRGISIAGGTVTSGTSYALTTDTTAGNIGFGTSTPASLLDVWGKIKGRIGAGLASFASGGTVADFFTDAGNVDTGETDLYSYTLPASGFNTNGDKLVFYSSGTFVSSGTATRQIRAYFGGAQVFDTGALSISASADWRLEVTCIRVSSSVVRCTGVLNTSGASLAAYTDYTEVTSLTLTNSQIMKVTGQAAGVGAATNDIVARMGYVEWKSNDD